MSLQAICCKYKHIGLLFPNTNNNYHQRLTAITLRADLSEDVRLAALFLMQRQAEAPMAFKSLCPPPQDLWHSLLVRSDSNEDPVPAETLVRTEERSVLERVAESQTRAQAQSSIHASRHSSNIMDTDMDVDAQAPSVSNQAQTETAPLQMPFRPLEGEVQPASVPSSGGRTLTLEEFDKLHPIQPRIAGPAPLPPTPTNNVAVAHFNHICQMRSITSSFTFNEIAKGFFTSKVEFDGNVCEERGPFASKKLAKEAVAQSALAVLESTEPSPEELKKAKERTKRKSSSQEDVGESWVAILHMFVQKHKHTQPEFQFFETDTMADQRRGLSDCSKAFSCTLSLQARPLYEFGSKDSLHPTKVEAKRAAAKDAVIWLRTVDMLAEPADGASLKRRKSSEDESQAESTKTTPKVNADQSVAQLVVALSLRLGLSQPQFEIKPYTTADGDFAGHNSYVCAGRYSDRDTQLVPQLQGPMCLTGPVYGQKNAKRMCCEGLVDVLEGIITERGNEQR